MRPANSLRAVAACAALSASAAYGQTATIHVAGDDKMSGVITRWEDGFVKTHPGIKFETKLNGSGTGIAALYTQTGDITFMGRRIAPVETMAFAWVFQYPPAEYIVATGSLDAPGKAPALAILVNKDNTLAKLTLAQLDAIFGVEHRGGAPETIRRWGQLGLTGPWADQAIHAYGPDVGSATAAFFRKTVLKDSYKWNWDALTEFNETAPGSVGDADAQAAAAVAKDRDGIAISTLHYLNPALRPVPIAAGDGKAYLPTQENLVSRRYPLTRTVYAYVNRAPGKPIDPDVDAFLHYVLSADGQHELELAGDFLPAPKDAGR